MITLDDIREVTRPLPRSYEVLVRGRVKFRVGQIVYVALSRDETTMGCGFPIEERAALVAAEPAKFFMPKSSEMRFKWIEIYMAGIGVDEMRELVLDAWAMCVPKKVSGAYFSGLLG